MSRWPRAYGFETYGIDSAKGLVTTGSNFGFNYCEFHPITYISGAFIGTRGSVIWHFNTESTGALEHIRMMRLPCDNSTIGEVVQSSNAPGTTSAFASYYMRTCRGGNGGNAVTNQLTQAGLSVLLPNYSNYKFESAAPTNACFAQSTDGTAYDCHMLEIALNGTAGPIPSNSKVWCYAGIGTDYSVLFFLNVPTLFFYSAVPTPN